MRRPKSLISSQLSSVKSSRFFLSIASLSFFPDRLFSSSFPYRSSMITLAISGNNPLHDRGCIPDYCASSKAKRLKQLRPGLTERSRAECEHRVRALMRAARASLFERLLNDLFAGRFDSGAADGFASLSRPLRHGAPCASAADSTSSPARSADRLPPPRSHLHVATAVPLASHPSTPAVAAPPLLYSSQFPSLPLFIHTKIWGAPLQGKPASALKDWAALFPSAQHDSEHRNHSMSALSTRHTNCSLRTKHTNYGPNDAAAVPAFTPRARASQNGGETAATSGFVNRLQAM